ncbi:MAG: hypothetical protein ABF820_10450 [Sporolactobacillus sp.]
MSDEMMMIMQAIKEVDANVKGLRAEVDEMKQDIAEMKQDIVVMKQDIVDMKQDIAEIKRELRKTNRRIDDMSDDLSEQIKLVHDENWETKKEVLKMKKQIDL